MKAQLIFAISCSALLSCTNNNVTTEIHTVSPFITSQKSTTSKKLTPEEKFYLQHNNDSIQSKSIGSVSNGKLINGVPFSYSGPNFQYFDKTSYFSLRGFTHSKVRSCVLESYKEMMTLAPKRKFYIMECANKSGGKIWPHRTHQNGLSVDFMIPKLRNQKPDYSLDTIGTNHYWLEFDNNGTYTKNNNIELDLNLMALHILTLNKIAKNQGLKIKKVIFKIELKDDLFKTEHGQQLRKSGIYFAQSLTPMINNLHDEHYQIDFEIVK